MAESGRPDPWRGTTSAPPSASPRGSNADASGPHGRELGPYSARNIASTPQLGWGTVMLASCALRRVQPTLRFWEALAKNPKHLPLTSSTRIDARDGRRVRSASQGEQVTVRSPNRCGALASRGRAWNEPHRSQRSADPGREIGAGLLRVGWRGRTLEASGQVSGGPRGSAVDGPSVSSRYAARAALPLGKE